MKRAAPTPNKEGASGNATEGEAAAPSSFIANVRMTGIFGIGFLLGILSLAVYYGNEFSSPTALRSTSLHHIDPRPERVNTSHGIVIRQHVQATNFVKNQDLVPKNTTKKPYVLPPRKPLNLTARVPPKPLARNATTTIKTNGTVAAKPTPTSTKPAPASVSINGKNATAVTSAAGAVGKTTPAVAGKTAPAAATTTAAAAAGKTAAAATTAAAAAGKTAAAATTVTVGKSAAATTTAAAAGKIAPTATAAATGKATPAANSTSAVAGKSAPVAATTTPAKPAPATAIKGKRLRKRL